LTTESIQKLEQLLKKLFERRDSVHFRQPVDYITLGLLDYPKVIKRKMDLRTVREKLADGQYDSVEECLTDVQLIWDNCKLYNTEDSPIYKMAQTMEAYAQKLSTELLGSVGPFRRTQKPVQTRSKESDGENSGRLSH
jgi:hypothetical protein